MVYFGASEDRKAEKRTSMRRNDGPESGSDIRKNRSQLRTRPDAGEEWTAELQGERHTSCAYVLSSLCRVCRRYPGKGIVPRGCRPRRTAPVNREAGSPGSG